MVGREVLLRVDEDSGSARRSRSSRSRTSTSSTTAGSRRFAASRSTCAAGEIVGIAGIDGNGQTELIDAMTGSAKSRAARSRSDGDDVTTARAPRATSRPGSGTSPRTGSAAGSCSSTRSPRTSRSTTTAARRPRGSAGCFRGRLIERARTADPGVRRARRRAAAHAPAALSGGNQQKVVLAREIERDPKVLIAAQPTRGLDVGAIEFVHRRLIEERDEGRAMLLVSLELEEILSLSDRILVMYEGEIVGEFPPTATEEELGIAMTGGGAERRRQRERSPRAPARASARRGRAGGPPRASRSDRARAARRRGRRAAPDRRCSRSSMGGLVVLVTTGKNPSTTYKAIFEGSGLNWFFPWSMGRANASLAAFNLQQTLIVTTTLILVGPRGRVRLPLRPVQHRRAGAVPLRSDPRRLDRVVVRGHEPVLHILLAVVIGTLAGAADRPGSQASSRRPSARTR